MMNQSYTEFQERVKTEIRHAIEENNVFRNITHGNARLLRFFERELYHENTFHDMTECILYCNGKISLEQSARILLFLNLLRMSYYIGFREGDKVTETSKAISDNLLGNAVTIASQIDTKVDCSQLIARHIAATKKYSVFIDNQMQNPVRWSEDYWNNYINIHPERLIAKEFLYIASPGYTDAFYERFDSLIFRVADSLNALHYIQYWKDHVVNNKVSPFRSMLISNNDAISSPKVIERYIYLSTEMDYLYKHLLSNYGDLMTEILFFFPEYGDKYKSETIELLLLRSDKAIRIINEARDYYTQVKTED